MLQVLACLLIVITSQIAAENAPIRYWLYESTDEATTWKNASIPFKAMFQHWTFTTEADSDALSRRTGRACYHNEISYQDVDTSAGGEHYKVVFSNPNITKFAVIKPYNDATHKARIVFDTTWHEMEGGNYSTLSQAIGENGLFNITFFTAADLDDPDLSCPEEEHYYVPQLWCDAKDAFQDNIIRAPIENDAEGRCRIEFKYQIEHYINMWIKGTTTADFKKRCLESFSPINDIKFEAFKIDTELYKDYPQFYKCQKKYGTNLPNCTDPKYNKNFFLTNAKGEAVKVVLARNNKTITLNMTIDFTYWTSEFIHTFANTFLKCGYKLPLTNLTMQYFIKDKIIIPERGTPISFWIFLIVIAAPAFVLFVSCLLYLCTRSRKGFRMELWDFLRWKRREKRKKIKKKKSSQNEKVIAELDNKAFEYE